MFTGFVGKIYNLSPFTPLRLVCGEVEGCHWVWSWVVNHQHDKKKVESKKTIRIGNVQEHSSFTEASLNRHLPLSLQQELLNAAQSRVLGRGQLLMRQEEHIGHFFFVSSGWIKLYHLTLEGNQVIHHFASSGETFGCFGACGCHSLSNQNAETLTNCTVLSWKNTTIKDFIFQHHQLAFNLLGEAVQRIKDLENRNLELSTKCVEQRLVLAIERILQRVSEPLSQSVSIPFPLSCQEIADYTGCSLYTISRILTSWELAGLIERGRQKLIICDLDRLKQEYLG